jgi:hypothetical protein
MVPLQAEDNHEQMNENLLSSENTKVNKSFMKWNSKAVMYSKKKNSVGNNKKLKTLFAKG